MVVVAKDEKQVRAVLACGVLHGLIISGVAKLGSQASTHYWNDMGKYFAKSR